jgi:hypothetical protein
VRPARSEPADLDDYGARDQTRTDQLTAARAHAGFRPWAEPETSALEAWLTVRAIEHERPKALFTLAAEQLHVQRTPRPSVDQLVRLIGAARARAHQATFDALPDQLTDRATRARLDRLLEQRADGTTWIEWLRTPAPDAAPRYILQQLEKFTYLGCRGRGVDALVKHDEVHAPRLQLGGERDQVLERASETIELRDDELVAGACGNEWRLVELGAGGELAAGLVDEDLVAAGGDEGVALAVGVLVAGRNAPVAHTHPRSVREHRWALRWRVHE